MNQKRKNRDKYRNWQERFGQYSHEEKISGKSEFSIDTGNWKIP